MKDKITFEELKDLEDRLSAVMRKAVATDAKIVEGHPKVGYRAHFTVRYQLDLDKIFRDPGYSSMLEIGDTIAAHMITTSMFNPERPIFQDGLHAQVQIYAANLSRREPMDPVTREINLPPYHPRYVLHVVCRLSVNFAEEPYTSTGKYSTEGYASPKSVVHYADITRQPQL